MPVAPKHIAELLARALGLVLLSACGALSNKAPVALAANLLLVEDGTATITLGGNDPEGKAVTFHIATPPSHGQAELDPLTGQLTYFVASDYFGTDQLWFTVTDVRGAHSLPAVVTITIDPVNDAPVLSAPPQATNSAHSFETIISFATSDVDSVALATSLTVDGEDVVRATLDPSANTITIEPLRRGIARLNLHVSDSMLSADATIEFEVTDVQKLATLILDRPGEQAVSIRNRLDREITFKLAHNDFPSFATVDEVATYVERLPLAYEGEIYPSKLWRFVRDNVLHDYPLAGEPWMYDPLTTLNSMGWGLCSNVASLYVRIARAAGYEARVWELSGHVVPEILVGAEWQVYDPDLAVFYRSESRSAADTAGLFANQTLVTSPIDPILDYSQYPEPYSSYVAEIYGSTSDNAVAPQFDGPSNSLDGTIRLPGGATLVYPGIWDEAPIGVDGSETFPIAQFRHASIELPAGFNGIVRLPWMIRAIQGSGRVDIQGTEYEIGSASLRDLLRMPQGVIDQIDVLSATSEIRLVFYVNAIRFGLTPTTRVSATGLEVWAAEISHVSLPLENRFPANFMIINAKPKSLLEQ